MLATKDSKKFEDVSRAKNAYFAYLSLVRAINTSIVQYNKKFPDYKLETLQSIPEPKFLASFVDLRKFFEVTLIDLKNLKIEEFRF